MRWNKWLTVKVWAQIGIFNLLLVASMGILMRLKFLLPMPFVNLKHLQHAHSHFAFAGWVTHALMLCLVVVTHRLSRGDQLPKHQMKILLANLFCSFGMLCSFIHQGYGAVSIMFSTLSILVSYCFAIALWKDLKVQQLDTKIARWFRVALIFLVLSSIGTFCLAYMMSTHQVEVKKQLAAIYFYLHFQYNGWFLFALLGLACHVLRRYGVHLKATDLLYNVLCVVTIPLYLLSVLWWDMGALAYSVLVLLTGSQCAIWVYWMISLYKTNLKSQIAIPNYIKTILWFVCWAVLLKVVLQTLSVIPALSHFVYGFRPVIIGYLHLVLLLIVSVFILSFQYQESLLKFDRQVVFSFTIFISGVVLNEFFLGVQAFFALIGEGLPYAHIYLLLAAIVIWGGLVGMLLKSTAYLQNDFREGCM